MSYVLVIGHPDDMAVTATDPPDLHGPFDTVREAQQYALDYRRTNGIPGTTNVNPSEEENEAWTDEGWYFAIVQPRKVDA